MAALYVRHDPVAQTGYQELKQLAGTQARALPGTPGTLRQRTRKNTPYWVREYVRADGRRDEEYLGTAEALGEKALEAIQEAAALARALARRSAKLRLFNYQRIERKTGAVLGALHNRGVFAGGITLVGSHAYGCLLNELGIAAAGYRTQDIDLARGRPLDLALPTDMDFQALLGESGMRFAAVPGMPSHAPSASYKLPGADALAVDLLVSGKDIGTIVPVRELSAHAQSIPLLDFLVADPLESVALSPNGAIPVRIPSAERFALHKLFSSQSRKHDRDKARKDLQQAAVLAAALEEEMPGALVERHGDLPRSARQAVKQGATAALRLLRLGEESPLVQLT